MAGGNGGRLVPLGLMGGPEEVATAGASCWADARYITGVNSAVDGGVRGNFVPRVIGTPVARSGQRCGRPDNASNEGWRPFSMCA